MAAASVGWWGIEDGAVGIAGGGGVLHGVVAVEDVLRELDLILSGRAGTIQQVWGHDDFLPVAAAFDRLFMSWGWTVTTLGAP